MIDSRPVPRIRILSVAMTTATGAAPGAPSSASCRTSRDRRRAPPRYDSRGTSTSPRRHERLGHGLPLCKKFELHLSPDRSQQRPAHGTRSSSRRRRDIFASAGNDDRGNDGQRLDHGHLEPAMAADALVFPSLNTARPNSALYVKSTSILRQTVMGIRDRRAIRRTRQHHRRRLRGRPARRATKDAPPRGVARHLTRLPAT